MRPEILAPVGSKEALEAALAAGCDAIYFGLPNFGARAYANNFTLEETKEVIDRCHLVNVKVYITMNTILYEDEIEQAYQQAKALHELGVDALIIQDLGLIHLLHHRLPNLVLHASTQLSVSKPEMIEQLKKLGVQRVVLARECTKEEIEACAKTGMEIEVFVHGALCICYSGQCTFSSFRFSRSGNRGMCAQPCRMPYTLLQDGQPVSKEEYLLSPKDLSLATHLEDLVKYQVASLKIEGRMKSAEYVYESVKAIQKGLDRIPLTKKEENNLKVTFHRGFTKGHLYDQKGHHLMNISSSNHQGIEIGKVVKVKKDRAYIQLTEDLYQHDGIRFETSKEGIGCRVNFLYDETGKLTNYVEKNTICQVEVPKGIEKGLVVRKTLDSHLQKEIQTQIHDTRRQIPVSIHCYCQGVGYPLIVTIDDGIYQAQVQSEEVALEAMNQPTSYDVLFKQFNKTKDTFVYIEYLTCELASGIYFPMGVLNKIRRVAIEALKECKLKKEPIVEVPYSYKPACTLLESDIVEIQNESQKGVQDFLWIQEGANKANLTHTKGEVLSHLGQGRIIDANMNTTNSYAVAALLELGYQGIVCSDECDIDKLSLLMEAFKNRYGYKAPMIQTIYQKTRWMIMNYCPVNMVLSNGKRENCSLCHHHKFELKSKDGLRLLCLGDSDCHMRLYDQEPKDFIDQLEQYMAIGVDCFKLNFVDENQNEINGILRRFQSAKEAVSIERNGL